MKKIILYSIAVILAIFFIEQILMLPYLMKTLIKLPMFLLLPWFIYKPKFKLINLSIALKVGCGVFIIILVAYFIFIPFIDFETIQADLENRMEMDVYIFVFAALYTIFINAFIEDFFFRGLIYEGLGKGMSANIYSAMLFAIYHIAIFVTWFSLPILLLILLGLFVGGMLFNMITKKTESFLGAYIVHIFADIAIVAIGFMSLNIIG